MSPKPAASARVEIDGSTLARLLQQGQMKACELRCLDDQSKQLVRKLCLDTCLGSCLRKQVSSPGACMVLPLYSGQDVTG